MKIFIGKRKSNWKISFNKSVFRFCFHCILSVENNNLLFLQVSYCFLGTGWELLDHDDQSI
jgi:hypothetical protein